MLGPPFRCLQFQSSPRTGCICSGDGSFAMEPGGCRTMQTDNAYGPCGSEVTMVLFSLCPEGLTCLLVAETSQTVQRVFIKTLAAAWVQAAACELKCCNVSVPFPPDCAREVSCISWFQQATCLSLPPDPCKLPFANSCLLHRTRFRERVGPRVAIPHA